MNTKTRLDIYITEKGLAPSREKAKAMIMAGIVFVDGEKCDKAGLLVKEDSQVVVKGHAIKYVSRGGLKLEKAIAKHHLNLTEKICMDIGASTGGFTDCMLQNGAQKVYAVDVGYGQLAWALRIDERVVSLERTNVRYLTAEQVPDALDFATIDVSFISLTLVLPVLFSFLREDGEAIILVKPQFEAGRENVGKRGVVRDPAVHKMVLEKIFSFCQESSIQVLDMDFSPIKGPEGNIEYLFYIRKSAQPSVMGETQISELVVRSHEMLNHGD